MTASALRSAIRVAVALLVAACAGAAIVWACGPFWTDFRTVSTPAPADPAAYDRGALGVVRPAFARRYLVQAYRTLTDAPQVPLEPLQPAPAVEPTAAVQRWNEARGRVAAAWPAGSDTRPELMEPARWLENFVSFDNCLVDSFARAIETLDARVQRYGAASRQVRDWTTAQDAVFANCSGKDPVIPNPPAAGADALERADRAYQTASAWFYAMRYDDAARAFAAISDDTDSPWRMYGHYLAGRAWLRAATVLDKEPGSYVRHLDQAASELQAVIADASATPLHASARGLLDLIAGRRDPLARLDTLSHRLATASSVSAADLTDYTRLMDIVLERSGTGDAGPQPRVSETALLEADEMTAWIVAMQQRSTAAVERWNRTRSTPWLVAALWSVPSQDAARSQLLAAAAQVPPSSRAYPMLAFLRARLHLQRGEMEEARRVLGVVPNAPTDRFDAETLNLLNAARMASAATLDDLLAAAPRRVVSLADGGPPQPPDPSMTFPKAVWDDDVATVFNARLPLADLVIAAESRRLPARLRSRVAQAAFSRAIVLDRHVEAARAARVLRELSPPVRADLDAYLASANDADRRLAAVLVLLRTPGLSINVPGMDTDNSYDAVEPSRRLGHAFARNWWCSPDSARAVDAGAMLFGEGVDRPFAPFLSDADRQATLAEREALGTAGDGRTFLIAAALEWAAARPNDPRVPEALARAIEGWRWSPCSYGDKSPLPQRAFTTLHRRYPNSEWTRRTPYWYE